MTTYKVISVMQVDYVTEIEMPDDATPEEIICAAEERGEWDADLTETSSTSEYFVNGQPVEVAPETLRAASLAALS